MYRGKQFCTVRRMSVLWESVLYCSKNFRVVGSPGSLFPQKAATNFAVQFLFLKSIDLVSFEGLGLLGSFFKKTATNSSARIISVLWESTLCCPTNFCTVGINSVPFEEFWYCGKQLCIVRRISVLWESILYCPKNFCTVGVNSVLFEEFPCGGVPRVPFSTKNCRQLLCTVSFNTTLIWCLLRVWASWAPFSKKLLPIPLLE